VPVCVWWWEGGTWCWVGRVEQDVFTNFGREMSGEVLSVSGRLGGDVRSSVSARKSDVRWNEQASSGTASVSCNTPL
jgi:hypothetical protein